MKRAIGSYPILLAAITTGLLYYCAAGQTIKSGQSAGRYLRQEAEAFRQAALRRRSPPKGIWQNPGDVDYLSYDIKLRLFPAGHYFEETTTAIFASRIDGLSHVCFVMFDDTMQIKSITLGQDTLSYTYSDSLWILEVQLPETLSAGQTDSVTIKYSGYVTPQLSSMMNNSVQLDTIYSYSTYSPFTTYPEPYDGFYGNSGPISEPAAYRIALTVPPNCRAVACGALIDSTCTDSTWSFTWYTPRQIGDESFAAAPYDMATRPYGSITLRYYDSDTSNAASIFAIATQALNCYSRLFHPYTFEKLALAEIGQGFGVAPYTLVTTTFPGAYYIQVHEISHQWWGNSILLKNFNEDWLCEGFASYSEALCAEDSMGLPGYQAEIQRHQDNYIGTPAAADCAIIPAPFSSNYYYYILYDKGACVLHMLRGVVGDSSFFAVMKNYATTYEDSSTTVDMFKSIVRQVYGDSLPWFFNQWLYRPGYPQYTQVAYYKTHPDSNAAICKIRQQPSVGALFKMPLALACSTAAGRRIALTFFDSLPYHQWLITDTLPIDRILLDPDDWVLKKLTDGLPRLRNIYIGNRQLTPVWNRFTADSILPAGYNLYRGLSSSGPFVRVNPAVIPDTSYLDTGLVNGTRYYYEVTAAAAGDTCYETHPSNRASRIPAGVEGEPAGRPVPTSLALANNRPNPFDRMTEIAFQLPEAGPVKLRVYNVAGQLVRTLVDGEQTAGWHTVAWNALDEQGRRVSGGAYFYRLQAGGKTLSRGSCLTR